MALWNRILCAQVHKLTQTFVVITARTHCSHDFIYITPIWLLCNLSILCVVDHLWLFYIYIYIYIHIKRKYRVQKQPLRNCFGQFFSFWLFLGCFNSFLILLWFVILNQNTCWGLFLVYTQIFIKYLSMELSFKSSMRFILFIRCLYRQNRY